MEENKYYKPSLDELHIGFEFERLIKMKGGTMVPIEEHCEVWDKEIINQHNLVQILTEWPNIIRVKYLDKEDLIELGFKPTYIKEASELIGGFDMHINEQCKILLFLTGENHVFIFRLLHCDDLYTGRWKTDLFDGKIKNKSELIKVLKMLGIK